MATASAAVAATGGGGAQPGGAGATGAAAATAPSACVFVSRQYFDQDRGAELVRRLSVDSLDSEMLDSYVFLASAHCLLRYIEATCAVRFPPGWVWWVLGRGWGFCFRKIRTWLLHISLPHTTKTSCLKIAFGYGQGGRLLIDQQTAKDLELVANARTGSQKKGSSLFGIINKTKVGQCMWA